MQKKLKEVLDHRACVCEDKTERHCFIRQRHSSVSSNSDVPPNLSANSVKAGRPRPLASITGFPSQSTPPELPGPSNQLRMLRRGFIQIGLVVALSVNFLLFVVLAALYASSPAYALPLRPKPIDL